MNNVDGMLYCKTGSTADCLENAIYYGVGNMDEDEGGKIIVRGETERD